MADGTTYKSLAVLIDAENVPAARFFEIDRIVRTMGNVTLTRCYGDFTSHPAASWNASIKPLGVDAFQEFHSTIGKNSADIALVVDAMDMMTSKKFDPFCIVSSDGDFTRLALRLRAEGRAVFGIGEERKTSARLHNACDRFEYLKAATEVPKKSSPVSVPKVASPSVKIPKTKTVTANAAILKAAARLINKAYNQRGGKNQQGFATWTGVVSQLDKNGHALAFSDCGAKSWEGVLQLLPEIFETTGAGNAKRIKPRAASVTNVVPMVG